MLSSTRRRFLRDALLAAPAWAVAPRLFAGIAPPAAGSTPRIATPDRAGTQAVLALGLTPVGAPPASFYRQMGGSPPLPADVPNTGYPVEPNLEMLKALAPDLIVTGTIDDSVRRMLTRVAPVLNLDIYTGEPGAYSRAVAQFRRLARAVGRDAAADAYVATLEAGIARTARALKPRGTRPAYLVTLDAGGRTMTVYGQNSIMYDVMTRIGMPNAWEGPTNGYGFTTVGVEKLTAHPDADLIYVNYGMETAAALRQLGSSPFWNSLPMVRAGRVHGIPLFDVLGSLPLARSFAVSLDEVFANGEARHG
ncbi:ABC transporter substrate-binding protein [Burkholderia stagnalis]